MKNFFKILMTIIITAGLTFGITMLWVSTGNVPFMQKNDVQEAFKSDINSVKIDLIKKKIDEVYKGEINEELMDEYTIKGYIAGLQDVYSTYYTKAYYATFTFFLYNKYTS